MAVPGLDPGIVPAIHAVPQPLLVQRFKQVQPTRIGVKDQPRLPGARPVLEVGLALNRVDPLVKLHVDKALEAIALCETFHEAFSMFISAAADVGRDTGVENAVWAVGHDVYPSA